MKMTTRAGLKIAIATVCAWFGLFCNPAQFWLADLTTGLTQAPATNQQGVEFNGRDLSPVAP